MPVIDDFLKDLPKPDRDELERVRSIVKQIVPEATESIGYGIPIMKYKDKYLLGFSGFKDHLSLFPGAEAVEVLRKKLGDYKLSKGTVQFTVEKPLPEVLIKEMLEICKTRIDKK